MKFRDWVAAAIAIAFCYWGAFHSNEKRPRMQTLTFLGSAVFVVPIAMALRRRWEQTVSWEDREARKAKAEQDSPVAPK